MEKYISFEQAFAYVRSTSSYQWGLGITLIILSIIWGVLFKVGKKVDVDKYKVFFAFITIVAIGIAVFGRAFMVAANTTVEAAARGHYIGW
jgi:hypothetical protein